MKKSPRQNAQTKWRNNMIASGFLWKSVFIPKNREQDFLDFVQGLKDEHQAA